MDLERKYAMDALEAVEKWSHLLPSDVQRKVKIAQSVFASYGLATTDEIRRELGGPNWVIAKRTKGIVARYGEDVIAVSSEKYHAAEIRAIESRF